MAYYPTGIPNTQPEVQSYGQPSSPPMNQSPWPQWYNNSPQGQPPFNPNPFAAQPMRMADGGSVTTGALSMAPQPVAGSQPMAQQGMVPLGGVSPQGPMAQGLGAQSPFSVPSAAQGEMLMGRPDMVQPMTQQQIAARQQAAAAHQRALILQQQLAAREQAAIAAAARRPNLPSIQQRQASSEQARGLASQINAMNAGQGPQTLEQLLQLARLGQQYGAATGNPGPSLEARVRAEDAAAKARAARAAQPQQNVFTRRLP